MKKLLLAGLLALAAVALVVTVATANNGNGHRNNGLHAKLDGYQQVPTLSSPGQGRFKAKVRGDVVEYKLQYSGLPTTVSAAHIHLGRPAVNGGVIAFLCGGADKPACPASGEVTGTIDIDDVDGPAAQGIKADEPTRFDEFVAALRAGATYVNVHTTEYPDGEIRGQIGGFGKFHGFGFGREGGKGHDHDDD
jgi:CHRD domain-containing protein